MNGFLVLLEIIVKLLIGVFGGAGVGMLVFGIGLMKEGIHDFRGYGPPPGPIFIGVGAGLLTAAALMLFLFMGPFSRRRWFATSDPYIDEPPKKWN
jgi:hypothetical protein